MKQEQHIIAVRTLRRSSERDIEFPGMNPNNGIHAYDTQDQITNILSDNGKNPISYGSIAIVHSNQPSYSTSGVLMDRIRRFSGYRIEELGGQICLRENEADTENKIRAFLDKYFQTNNKVLIILCTLPWVPALIEEGLDIGAPAGMPLEEMQYMFPSGYAFDFIRKTP